MDEFLEEVSREEWGALPPKSTVDIEYPLEYVRYQLTGPDVFCRNKEECIPLLRKLQKRHMEELGLPDIKFNFLIGPDGVVYECRGFKHDAYDPVKHHEYWKTKFLNVGFFGDFRRSVAKLPMKAERAAITQYFRMKEQGMVVEEVIPVYFTYGNKDYTWFSP